MTSVIKESTDPLQPIYLPECNLWLDGSDASTQTVSGTNVTEWRDKSGKGNHGTTTGGTTTVSTLNSVRALSFNATSSFQGVISNTTATLTSFMVATMSGSTAASGRLLSVGLPTESDNGGASSSTLLNRLTNTSQVYSTRTGVNTTIFTISLNTPLLIVTQYTGSQNAIYLNGTQQGNSANVSGNFGYQRYRVGDTAGSGSTAKWAGLVGELIIYNASLTSRNRQIIEGYLAWKWGLTANLPSTHPYKNSSPSLVPPLQGGLSFTYPLAPAKSARLYLNPLTITSCSLWLDATDLSTITLSGSSVSQWRDKASSFTYSGTGSLATSNTYQCVRFDGNQGMTTTASLPFSKVCTNSANMTCILVLNTSSSTGVNGAPFTLNFSEPRFMPFLNSGGSLFFDAGYQANPRLSGTYTNNARQIQVFNRFGITQLQYRLNGSVNSSFNFGNPANYGNQSYTGYISPSGARWTGDIHEALYFSDDIGLTMIQNVEGYLAWKWGLVANLPSTHPYKNSPLGPQSPPLSLPQIVRQAFRPTVTRFTYTGSAQTYTVPANTSLMYVYLWGAGGGRNAVDTGAGAFVSGTVNVTPGATYSIVVGKNGNTNGTVRGTMAEGGGGAGSYSYFGGGGFSGIFSGGSLVIGSLVAIAGGGGTASFGPRGGSGGVLTGGTGTSPGGGYPGTGGTQTAGGTTLPGTFTSTYGEQFFGGAGRIEGPGGGGGYYGGGGSDPRFQPGQLYAGSGGGSSYTGGFASILGTADGATPNGSTTTQPGGTTNQYYVSPWGQGLQHGYAVIVTLAP
jgi:hypothetical protein